jgi:hypothetical protein
MSERITITLPLPPRECSPNYHGHWRGRQKATRAYRLQAALTAHRALPRNWQPQKVRVSADFYCGRGPVPDGRVRPLDTANAIGCLKAAIDGAIIDGGFCPSDSHEWVEWGTVNLYRRKKDHGGQAFVLLRIEPLPAREAAP